MDSDSHVSDGPRTARTVWHWMSLLRQTGERAQMDPESVQGCHHVGPPNLVVEIGPTMTNGREHEGWVVWVDFGLRMAVEVGQREEMRRCHRT